MKYETVKLLLLISLIYSIHAESRRQPQQPSYSIQKPRGLHYSPISRGGSLSDCSKFGIYSSSNNDKPKIKSLAWTPEKIKSLLICDDITALEDDYELDEQDYRTFQETSNKAGMAFQKLISSNVVLNRMSNRIHLASSKCCELLNHATDHSMGAKIYHDIKAKYLVYRGTNDNDDSDGILENSILDEDERESFLQQADILLHSVSKALEDDSIWLKLVDKDGVSVWRSNTDVKNYSSCLKTSSNDEVQDFATIRSEAIMTASPKEVYDLFMDNNRVHEYNDNCKELEDLEILCNNANMIAKINWSATGKMGPFAARDFVTLVTFKPLDDKENSSFVSLAVHVDHPKLAPTRNGYVRSQIQLAATFMHAVPGRPNMTRLVQVTQVGELGGVADSPIARRITSNLAEKAPVEFMKKFNNAVNRRSGATLERKEV